MEKATAVTVCLLWLLLFLAVSTPASSPPTFLVPQDEATENTWTTKASMPTARTNLGTAVVKGKVFAIGGGNYSIGGALNVNEMYDPQTDVWSRGADMPTARHGLGIVVVDDVLFAIGGDSAGYFTFFSSNEQYTPFGYGTVPPPETTPPFPTWIVAAIAIIVVVGAVLLVYFKKIKKTTGKPG